MKRLEEYTPAAKILAALANPAALLILDFVINSDDLVTAEQIAEATGRPLGLIAVEVGNLVRAEILLMTGESFSQPIPLYIMLNEDMPDLARVVIEAIWSDQPRPGDVRLTVEGPTFMEITTPGYNSGYTFDQTPITVEAPTYTLEIDGCKIKIKPYGKYVNKMHLDLFSRSVQDLKTPAEMRLYAIGWNAARDPVQAPLYDFMVDLDYPEAPWNG